MPAFQTKIILKTYSLSLLFKKLLCIENLSKIYENVQKFIEICYFKSDNFVIKILM